MEYTLRPYQQECVDIVDRLPDGSKAVVALATGLGKCLGKGTPIIMFDGSTKKVENILAGDLLIGPDSMPRRVVSLAHGSEMLYRIVPEKGDPYIVNESHILSLKIDDKIINISVKDYLASSDEFKREAKGWRTGVSFQSSGEYRFPLLGAMIARRGFIDDDKKCYSIYIDQKSLKDDLFLIRSLGFAAYQSGNVIEIYGNLKSIPILGSNGSDFLNKAIEYSVPNEIVSKVSISVESIGVGEYFGFEIDGPDRLFLLGDFTVTHNTTTAAKFERKGRMLWLSHRDELVRQPEKYFNGVSFGIEKADETSNGEDIVSASVQTISKDNRLKKFQPNEFDIIIVDECHHAAAPTYRNDIVKIS